MAVAWLFSLILILVLCCRTYAIIPPFLSRPLSRRKNPTCHFAVFLGSGGHTSEALLLLSSIDFSRYTPRTYVVSQGDHLSVQRAAELESSKNQYLSSREGYKSFTFVTIPRARYVHQSLLTTPPTAALSLVTCLYHICLLPFFTRKPFAEVLLVNGPGTCVMLCIAVYMSRLLFIPNPRLIYVESFARVRSLSLSGRLLRPFVDRFVVQWPEALKDGRRGDYRGWLV